MADYFKKVNTGEDVVFFSETFNSFLEAGAAERRRQLSRTSQPAEDSPQGTLVKIKNESGVDLLRGSVLGLDAPLFPPATTSEAAFTREVTFRGVIPTSSHLGKFCILFDPIADGAIGRAYVDGAAPVQISIISASHTCADISPGDTDKLVSMASGGSAAILWPSGSTGTLWGVARFGTLCAPANISGSITVRMCNTTAGGSHTVTLVQGGTTVFSGTTSSGFLAFSIPTGTYDLTITPESGSGFAVDTSTVTYTGGSITRTLVVDSDHVCTTCCAYPIPKVLNGSHGGETFTITYDLASSNPSGGIWTWIGSGTKTVAITANPGAGTFDPCDYTGSTLNVNYLMQCASDGLVFSLTFKAIFCNDPPFGTPGFFTHHYPSNLISGAHGMHALAGPTVPSLPCFPYFQQFVLPENSDTDISGLGSPIPTPGGGGAGNLVTISA